MAADQFQLFFTEAKAGWLESRIILNESHYDLSVSVAFSEPLRDLFRCLCDVHGLDGPTDMATDYRHCEFEWGGEGWVYMWQVTPRPGGELAIRVEFKGKREQGGKEFPVWDIDVVLPWQTLAEQAFTQGAEMLWMYGFCGYQERWTKDFPAAEMMRLGHLLHDQPMNTTDFSRELGYLAETR